MISADVCGKSRSQRLGSRVIGASNRLLLLASTISVDQLSVSSVVRISTSSAYFGNLRLLVILSGSIINPMSIYAPLEPTYDLALAIYDVGRMSRLCLSNQLASTCLVSLKSVSDFVSHLIFYQAFVHLLDLVWSPVYAFS